MRRKIKVAAISTTVSQLCQQANYCIGRDVSQALAQARKKEVSPIGREILTQILQNHDIARREKLPLCQDCGYAVVFLDVGWKVIFDGDPYQAINQGVRHGYRNGFLRKSIISDPLRGINTGDNTPAVIYTRFIPGQKVRITVMPKGAGSENMSSIRMFKPNDGIKTIKNFIREQVVKAGPNACPPLLIGIGIGGTFEQASLLAKRALMRKIGQRHPDSFYGRLEKQILREVNQTGLGPMGLGGTTTALDVFIEPFARHLASLPVAVNLNCHAARHKTAVL